MVTMEEIQGYIEHDIMLGLCSMLVTFVYVTNPVLGIDIWGVDT